MTVYRLRRNQKAGWHFWSEDRKEFFVQDKISPNVGTFYLTHEAAVRALSQLDDRFSDHPRYDIVAFTLEEQHGV